VSQYLPVLVLFVLAMAFGLISLAVSITLSPKARSNAKEAPYECGIVPGREPPERFPVRFYLVAMIFIVFDIEIIFFFPWAVVFRELGGYGLAVIGLFALLVFESFVYLIGNGALEWGPKMRQRRANVVSPDRTLTNTIRRVGTEGRPAALEPAARTAAHAPAAHASAAHAPAVHAAAGHGEAA